MVEEDEKVLVLEEGEEVGSGDLDDGGVADST